MNYKKTLLVAINAKFIHSSLAVRCLKNYCADKIDAEISFCEYTINHQTDFILEELYRQKPDILAFSVYIWNIDMVLALCDSYRKVAPDTVIILGGPEVSYNPKEVLEQNPFLDYVIVGEGEEPFCELIEALTKGENPAAIHCIYSQNSSCNSINNTTRTIDLDHIAFPYPDLALLDHRIFYYESSRGCPFNCQYCLSSTEKGVRFKSLPLVFDDLKRFIEAGVGQVKFVDRTFNCNKNHALSIWRFLSEQDRGITNFHFEITAELLDEETLAFLETVRKGLFQFEIGVQSTNPTTLAAIDRKTDLQRLFAVTAKLKSYGNIHQHLDLIAGLPFEGFASFGKSFDEVFAQHPEQLQLGFLKLLKGSGLFRDKEKYGLVYRSYAPYEVLFTPDLTFAEALKLKAVEEMTELYYNSGRFDCMLELLLADYASPFAFFLALGDYFKTQQYHTMSHGKERYYTILKEFYLTTHDAVSRELILACRFDIMCHEKPKKIPDWAEDATTASYHKKILDFLSNKHNLETHLPDYVGLDPKFIIKVLHAEIFANPKPMLVIFDYKNRDILGKAKVISFDIEQI